MFDYYRPLKTSPGFKTKKMYSSPFYPKTELDFGCFLDTILSTLKETITSFILQKEHFEAKKALP